MTLIYLALPAAVGFVISLLTGEHRAVREANEMKRTAPIAHSRLVPLLHSYPTGLGLPDGRLSGVAERCAESIRVER